MDGTTGRPHSPRSASRLSSGQRWRRQFMLASLLALALLFAGILPASWPGLVQSDVGISPVGPVGVPSSRPPLSSLAVRLQIERTAIVRDSSGQVSAIFGLPAGDARMLLLPVNRQRRLPDGYEPPDLSWYGGRLVRSLVKPDLSAM